MNSSISCYDQGGLGLRRVKIPRSHNGFGFTLRHFIVYPPELYADDEGDAHKMRSRRMVKVTEPVDTIFVKSIVKNGPAGRAGLCVGDRIVSVNGQTIFGKSYDQVVQLIQRTEDKLSLEVSPKHYDTLQLFYEDTAYRPETNQRPNYTPNGSSEQHLSSDYSFEHFDSSRYLPIYDRHVSNNFSSDPFFLNSNHHNNYSMSAPHSNTSNSNPQLFSHLPRPTPYKSSPVWNSTLGSPSQQHARAGITPASISSAKAVGSRQQSSRSQPQTYYPFNQQDLRSSSGVSPLRKIKEETNSGAKSAESILAGNDGGFYDTSQRSGSMECLARIMSSSDPKPREDWNDMGPGYRYSVAVDGNTSVNTSSQRRESTGSMSHPNNAMVVTMSSTNSKLLCPYRNHSGDPTALLPDQTDNFYNSTSQHGYETKIVDRIKRSCEQKEEFLKRQIQPLSWAPQSSSSVFPKELYAQPQKFEKIPWPPEHILPTVTSAKSPVTQGSIANSHSNSVDSESKMISNNNVSVVTVQHYQDFGYSPRTNEGRDGSDYNSARNRNIHVYNNSTPAQDARSISPSWLEYIPKNRTTIVGGGKLHCDPPSHWTSTMGSYDASVEEEDEESGNFSTKLETDIEPEGLWILDSNVRKGKGYPLRGYLAAPQMTYYEESTYKQSENGIQKVSSKSQPLQLPSLNEGFVIDSNVILRRKDGELSDPEGDRLVRRVSYLKATSSPIDMDRKNSSPSSPTKSCDFLGKTPNPDAGGERRRSVANKLSADFFQKGRIIRLRQFFEDRTQPPSIFKFSIDSPTTEFRGFGTFRSDKTPDTSEVIREGQIHFKIRIGESKRGGYNRSWRQAWVQVRRSGCLYISKERLSKDAVVISDNSVIIALSLKSGVTVEEADYSKRKHVLKLKTSYTSEDIVPQISSDSNIYSSVSSNVPSSSHNQPSHSTSVEILIQAEDSHDYLLWLQCLHTQIENNNFCTANSTNFKGIFFGTEFCPKPKSILTSLLPSPAATAVSIPGQSSSLEKYANNGNNNTLLPPGAHHLGNIASPKTKTWKGKVARGWKKVHNIIDTSADSKIPSTYTSLPPAGTTFGISLEQCPAGEKNPLVPRVIEYGVDLIESRGIDMVGVYRIPGNSASVTALTDRLNRGEDPNPDKDPKWLDVHVVASLVKSFLRRLPDPLLTDERYHAFIQAAEEEDPEACCEKMQFLINDLPPHNYETLRTVILHLKNVADHGESNKMFIRNLAIVFGPTIVRTADESVTNLVTDMKNMCKIVEILVTNASQLFKSSRRESCYTPSPPSETIMSESADPTLSTALSSADPGPSSILSIQSTTESASEHSNISTRPSVSPVPTIESEIKNSVLKAAMRKASQKSNRQKAQNVHPPKRTKPIDEAGFIRSYAGLNEETEERVKKFELETRAMLSREDRSPYSSAQNVGIGHNKPVKLDEININRLKLDHELQRAKDDLENEDFYDQLADNPSSIVHHRDRALPMFAVTPGIRNLSSSSISSSNSNNTAQSSFQTPQTIISKPNTFALSESLPPKPPQVHSSGSSLIGPQSKSSLSSSSSPISPLRRVGSMDRLGTVEFNPSSTDSPAVLKFFDRNKILDRKLGPMPFVPKHFGSLDSLKDIANGNNNNSDGTVISTGGDGFGQNTNEMMGKGVTPRDDYSPRSSEGSDLVTSLSRTLERKLQGLRRSQERTSTAFSSLSSSNNMDSQDENEGEVFEEQHEPTRVFTKESPKIVSSSHEDEDHRSLESSDPPVPVTPLVTQSIEVNKTPKVTANGSASKRTWRRNSMFERKLKRDDFNQNGGSVANGGEDDCAHVDRVHKNGDVGRDVAVTNGGERQVLNKDSKTLTNRFKRDCRRRHSLSSAGDILSFVFGSKEKDKQFGGESAGKANSHNQTLSNEAISPAFTSTGILESHV